MIITELIYNLSLLISISIFSEFIDEKWPYIKLFGRILQGFLFGTAALISMSFPYLLYKGLIFDARSIAISVSTLFFGPLSGSIATIMALVYRLILGGIGTGMGIVFIIVSYGVGVAGYILRSKHSPEWLTYGRIYLFGFLVHAVALLSVFALPSEKILFTIQRTAPTFIILYPVGTLMIGTVLKMEEDRRRKTDEIKEREALFRTTLYSIGDGVISTDSSGRIMNINRSAEQLTGWKEDEARGLSIEKVFNIVNEETGERLENPLTRVVKEGTVVGLANHTLLIRKDGKEIPISDSGAPILDSNGKLNGMVLVFRDQTIERESRRLVEQSERKMRGIVEGTPHLFFYVQNKNGDLTYISPSVKQITGYSVEEWLARRDWFITDNPVNSVAKKKTQEHLNFLAGEVYGENWKPEPILIEISHKDGHRIWLEVYESPIVENGKVVGLQGVAHDITEQFHAERSERLESIGTLASGIAHDLNNILGIVIGNAQLIERSKEDRSRLDKSINAIISAANRGASLVKQLLAFAGKTATQLEAVSVNGIVREVEELIKETFPRTIEIRTELDPSVPLTVADPGQIHQILLNLCVNSRDAMVDGGKLLILTKLVSGNDLRREFPDAKFEKYVKVEVSDTGIGMDELTKSKIFDPFFTTKEFGKGTGLGLSVVFGAVRKHQGFIKVDSKPNEGTTFTVYLPIIAEPVQIEDVSIPLVKSDEITRDEQKTVLVVEDEEMLRQLLTDVLLSNGYDVVCVDDGKKAVEKYQELMDDIGVVLADYGLPVINGQELAKRILEINPMARIIIASGYIDPQDVEKLYRLGVKEIVQKPYSPDDILLKISKVLQTRDLI